MTSPLTTPFGRGSVTPAQIRAQAEANACPNGIAVQKWEVFRDVATARRRLGLADRALAVLNALLTFHPDPVLAAGEGAGCVVFPSNAALALRAHGIAEATLRRHLAGLIEAGLIIRRDSPNGKRYARRGQGGLIHQAFGFDLTPLVARAVELADLADAVRSEAKALRIARERVTLLRRDCVKLIEALETVDPSRAQSLRDHYRHAISTWPRHPAVADLAAIGHALGLLAESAGKLLTEHHKDPDSNGNARQIERHRQSSDSDDPVSEAAANATHDEAESSPRQAASPRRRQGDAYPLAMILDACPSLLDFAPHGIRSWGELTGTADLVRAAMGIGSDLWCEAQDAMGPAMAAATVAAMLQRGDKIRSPGGYLRSLSLRRRAGEYSLGPVLQALMRARLAGGGPPDGGPPAISGAGEGGKGHPSPRTAPAAIPAAWTRPLEADPSPSAEDGSQAGIGRRRKGRGGGRDRRPLAPSGGQGPFTGGVREP